MSCHVGLDHTLVYSGTLFLPAKVIARRGVPLILRQDNAGRVMLPFMVQGTVSAPRRPRWPEKILQDLFRR